LDLAAGKKRFARSEIPSILLNLAAILVATSIFFGAGLFLTGRLLLSAFFLAGTVLVSSGLGLYSSFAFPHDGEATRTRLIANGAVCFFAAGVLVFIFYLRSVPGPNSEAICLSFPVKGTWRVVTGGRSRVTNYHHGRPHAQDYAIDLVLVGKEGASAGMTIFSPLDGTVTESFGDRGMDSLEPEGNLVVIKSNGEPEVWLAHLEQDSVLVEERMRVSTGQPIARCGSTGSADVAHLHIHAQRGAKPVPMLFGERRRFLLRNDLISE
jgi:murein DD-endopeptidase MepM/ murein hydrolase activator NlpD